ncbi:transposase [Streptomyces bobili]|uniref:transposase n=1 Tax=Streptomyces bobili TaxID=67280 RepID=UPI002256B15D|nr:transposase [Streptomyces bobili]MCX5521482.1 transposase [Streptomyces bobili]
MGNAGAAPAAGAKTGQPHVWPRRQLTDGIRFRFRFRTGVPWRDVPVTYGLWARIYDLFRRWQRNGTWHQVLTPLQSLARREGRDRVGPERRLHRTQGVCAPYPPPNLTGRLRSCSCPPKPSPPPC